MKILRNVIIALVVIIGLSVGVVKLVVVPKTSQVVTEQVINQVGSAKGLSEEQIDYINTQVDKEDQQAIEEIVSNHMFDKEIVSQAARLVESGDRAALKRLAEENLTDDEQEKMKALYEKYEGKIDEIYLPE